VDAESDALFEDADEDSIDLILNDGEESASDTAEQPQPPASDLGGDTAEQPALDSDAEIDLDIGALDVDTIVPDDATMTEVGTKLDLARAYIDMGDPEGARSILNEVIDEGGDSQQQEARQLLEELSD
jgi:pilus assembly protein FimV